MPGINLISVKSCNSDLAIKFANAQLSMKHDHTYKSRIFVESDCVMIGCTGYDEYPMRSWESSDCVVVQEGMIYNRSKNEVDSFVLNLVSQNRRSSISIDDVKDFLLNSDGEFVILIYDKLSKDLIILNDLLGRLPLYYFEDDRQFILSREVKFITKFMPHVNFDRLGVAEYLLFGYPLGERTLVENVNRLDPAVLLRYHVSSGRLNVDKAHVWNFENSFSQVAPIQEHADALAKLFRNAVKCRVESLKGFKNLVSLSGGLDSRAIAAVLKEVDPEMSAVTFLDYERKSLADVDVAQKVAQKFHIDWNLVRLEKRRFEDLEHLIELKDGLNYAAMGFILDFFVDIKRKFGDKVVYYTGDGGNYSLYDFGLKETNSMDELIGAIIDELVLRVGSFEISEVTKLVNISAEQIRTEIMDVLLNYPENDLKQKYYHFIVFERGYKWIFEGEDRNRFYFWSTSPYWSPIFFDYAMKIPYNYAKYQNLRRMFLERLDKNCLKVRYANWPRQGYLLGSLSYYLLPRISEIVSSNHFLRKMKEKMTRTAHDTKYDPREAISNYHSIHASSHLSEIMMLDNSKELLDMNLN
ncbi:MAG: asparagine synthase-related protein, partial [Candidatus Bathyarchaeota archaeon]